MPLFAPLSVERNAMGEILTNEVLPRSCIEMGDDFGDSCDGSRRNAAARGGPGKYSSSLSISLSLSECPSPRYLSKR